jgi:hypothetical protein
VAKLVKPAEGALPGTCKLGCGANLGYPHAEGCQLKGRRVGFDEVVQLGGEPAMLLDNEEAPQSRLALFLYRMLRDHTPGQIEQAAVEAEAAARSKGIEVSNAILFTYAENVANRLLLGSQPVQQAREIVEGVLALLGPEGVQPTGAERSVLEINAEGWLEAWGPEPISIDDAEQAATSDAGHGDAP